jgi:hypothetical protein
MGKEKKLGSNSWGSAWSLLNTIPHAPGEKIVVKWASTLGEKRRFWGLDFFFGLFS